MKLFLFLMLLPSMSLAMNTPMGAGADMGVFSNTYITVGNPGAQDNMLDNSSDGSVVVFAKIGQDENPNDNNLNQMFVSSTDETANLKTFFCGFREPGELSTYHRISGTTKQEWGLTTYRNNGGLTNTGWHSFIYVSDGLSNIFFLDGSSATTNLPVSSVGHVWFHTSRRSSSIGASWQSRTLSFDDGNHFPGTIGMIVTYTDQLTISEIERIANTRGRWMPRDNVYNFWSGMDRYGSGTVLTNRTPNPFVNYGTRSTATATTNTVTAGEFYRRRRRRQ